MALLRKVVSAFEIIAPLHLAETSWDNVGILLEAPFPKDTQQGVFLTIDLTPSVLEEALSLGNVGVIVAYHPTIFRSWKRLCPSEPNDPEALKKGLILQMAAKGISLYSPHTALDSTFQGVNDWLASGLPPIAKVEPIVPTLVSSTERPEGQGRLATLAAPCDLSVLVHCIKKHLGINHVRVATSPRNHRVQTVAICAGSGASVLKKAVADVYWTGEIGHHDVLQALSTTHVVACEHTNTERGYLSRLKQRLEKEFGMLVYQSQMDHEPLKIM